MPSRGLSGLGGVVERVLARSSNDGARVRKLVPSTPTHPRRRSPSRRGGSLRACVACTVSRPFLRSRNDSDRTSALPATLSDMDAESAASKLRDRLVALDWWA